MGSVDLDGKYQVTSVTNQDSKVKGKSDGVTEIRDGQTSRVDDNGVLWTSTFNVLNDKEVEMVSVADPTRARADFALLQPDGVPTRQPVTYRAVLKLARKGDKIQISGPVEYGKEVVFLTLRKVVS